MFTDAQRSAIAEFTEYLFQNEMDYYRERAKTSEMDANRLAALTQEQLTEFRERLRERSEKDAAAFLDTEQLLDRVRTGVLHPSNGGWRKLFTALTGCQLPSGANATRDALREYIGAERQDVYYAARQAAADAKVQAKQEADEQRERERLAAIVGKVKADEGIDGSQLADLARSMGIDLHPRTVGTLRKRVVSITSNGGRVTGRGHLPSTVWNLYRQVRAQVAA